MLRALAPCLGITFSFLVASSVSVAQELDFECTRKISEAKFVHDDVRNFIRAQEMLTDEADTIAVLEKEYFDKGTPGLREFIKKYGLSAESLLKAMRKHPEKYAALHSLLDAIKELESTVRGSLADLQRYMPDVVFPPTYFLVETHRGIGSGSAVGQLIAIDKWVPPLEEKTTMIIHEMVHLQQVMAVGYPKYLALFGNEKNLLGLCIREGTAEFFAHLATGRITQDKALEYTLEHEERLWKWLAQEMDGAETGDWMWRKPADPDQPYHVGYAMGYRIVEAYYNQASDRAQAVKDILSVTDYTSFLENSHYADRFGD